ncbi:MAG: disulfide oxidoreductase [Alphaproteobacteria bacterium]|nr:disulfide oxidoreductase [Alphaproteobacteria bacterium]
MQLQSGARVLAVLGPTNTGKTHLAIERMLGHASGMIGFPLRLLARENYDRIVKAKGARSVALITGEEKIVPPEPRWFVCTVESMPLDRPVEFLAVDEIQLCADPERGHVFTDRLLHARGRSETMFLGAETIRPLLRRLVPEAEFETRPRFSNLAYSGPRKLTRLPPRSAVVAFSAAQVYEIAEMVRRARGGAAVVLGALSPRTRNAQVGLFQEGAVDYLVATDAIGMGLNMDLDHVCFAGLSKFDGRGSRRLQPAELAQIAGRAGRHMSDGTFGTTQELGPLDEGLVEAIEAHRFDPLDHLFWRNADLDFSDPQRLKRSLEARSPAPFLIRAREADDQLALAALLRDREIAESAWSPQRTRLLWEVCQIPDFRKTMTDAHARMLGRVFRFLQASDARLPEDWVATQVSRLDATLGDIDTLTARIAHVRTWTYISHRADWLVRAAYWQERTRAIEDKLSDALHERLTQRFIDRRAAALSRRSGDGEALLGGVTREGDVVVEAHVIGRLKGFAFVPEAGPHGESRAVLAVARRALAGEMARRVQRLVEEPDSAFTLRAADARVLWHDEPVARLVPGDVPACPRIEPLRSDLLDGALKARVRHRLEAWLAAELARAFAALRRLERAPLAGAGRGIAFQLIEALGVLPRQAVETQLAALAPAEAQALVRLGVRLGAETVFLPAMIKPAAQALKSVLWDVHAGTRFRPPPVGATSLPVDPSRPEALDLALGFRRLGPRLIRVDRIEQLSAGCRRLARQGPFAATPALAAIAGCAEGEIAGILKALGYRAEVGANGVSFAPRRRRDGRRRRARGSGDGVGATAAAGPFARLGELVAVRRKP